MTKSEEIRQLVADAAREVLDSGNYLNREEANRIFDEKLAGTSNRDVAHVKMTAEKVSSFVEKLASGETRDLQTTVDANGGYLVPEEWANFIIEKMYKLPTLRAFCTVLPMSTDTENIAVEGNTNSVSWFNELATITQADGTVAQVRLIVNLVAGLSRMSRQFLADATTAAGRLDWITTRIAQAINRAEEAAFVGGSGTGQPAGFRGVAGASSVAQAGANIALDDLINLKFTLGYQYRDNAIYAAHDNLVQKIAKLKDSTGRPLYEMQSTTTIGDSPVKYMTLNSRPLLTLNDLPVNLGGGTNESEIWYFDPSFYIIGDREDISAEYSTQEGTSFEKHRAALKVWKRVDGKPSIGEAFAKLTAAK